MMNTKNPVLYIVVPCYNEEEVLPISIKAFLDKVETLCSIDNAKSRVVLVDDGSADRTWDIIRELSRSNEHVIGLRHDRNRGHQNAVMTGLMWSLGRCDITVSIDADLQDDINSIDKMVGKYEEGSDIVCGVRSRRDTDTFLKRTTARMYYRIMKLTGLDLIYDHADFRLMDTKALNKLSYYHQDNLFLRGTITKLGLPTAVVTYDREERKAGQSKYTLKKMLQLAFKGVECRKYAPSETPCGSDRYLKETTEDEVK